MMTPRRVTMRHFMRGQLTTSAGLPPIRQPMATIRLPIMQPCQVFDRESGEDITNEMRKGLWGLRMKDLRRRAYAEGVSQDRLNEIAGAVGGGTSAVDAQSRKAKEREAIIELLLSGAAPVPSHVQVLWREAAKLGHKDRPWPKPQQAAWEQCHWHHGETKHIRTGNRPNTEYQYKIRFKYEFGKGQFQPTQTYTTTDADDVEPWAGYFARMNGSFEKPDRGGRLDLSGVEANGGSGTAGLIAAERQHVLKAKRSNGILDVAAAVGVVDK